METTTANKIVIKTADQLRRAEVALAETHKQISREMGYSEDLRKSDLVAKWQEHVKNIEAAIAAYPVNGLETIWTFEEISQDTYGIAVWTLSGWTMVRQLALAFHIQSSRGCLSSGWRR